MNNTTSILLRRKNKVVLSSEILSGVCSDAVLGTFNLNIQSLGYTLSSKLIKALRRIDESAVISLLNKVLLTLKGMKGDNKYRPMYPNFPAQVMEASDAELYLNAITHYFSFMVVDLTGNPENIWLPKYAKNKREPLDEKIELQVLDAAKEEDLKNLATALVTSNTSISATDKEDLQALHTGGYLGLPKTIPNKENLSFVGALFFKEAKFVEDSKLNSLFQTATDVLRLATALSDGDVSLTEDSKFISFKRSERRGLLSLLDQCGSLKEDMLRWKERWLRLGERLHPGEYEGKFPFAFEAFKSIRENEPIETFNSLAERLIRNREVVKATSLLSQRPGDFARRLDHLLRHAETKVRQQRVVDAFLSVASEASTPVLLQVINHFESRTDELRVAFPKGNVAKVQALQPLPDSPKIVNTIIPGIKNVLVRRFSKLPKLGKVYIDPQLKDCLVPFSQRSASKSLRTLVRGSKLSFGDEKDTLRFFVYWKEGDERADIDLSASLFSAEWEYVGALTYYDLREGFGCHSGDITSAPKGASEFIDININKALSYGRYVLMTLNVFTRQNFSDLNECYAGWMLRDKPESGEIYDPRTVNDKVDISMQTMSGIPLIIDMAERKIIWCDLAWSTNRFGLNNVHDNRNTIQLMGQAMSTLRKPNLYDLFSLHADARGKITDKQEKADIVFSVEQGTPFQLEKIASEFLANEIKIKKAVSSV